MVNSRTTTTQQTVHYKRAVGVFKRREDIEGVIRALKDADYDMNRVSLIAKHIEGVEGAEEIVDTERGGNESQEGAGIGATTGTVLGGVTGLLIGIGVLAIPGVGPILAAGAEINALASTLAGAGIGAATGGIVGALVGLGIPEEQAKTYNERVKAGQYLLMVSGTDADLRRVESILRDRNIEEFNIYDAPDLTDARPATTVRQDVATTPDRDRMATRNVTTDTRRTPTDIHSATDTRDIDRDGEAEVFIVDNRNEAQRQDRTTR